MKQNIRGVNLFSFSRLNIIDNINNNRAVYLVNFGVCNGTVVVQHENQGIRSRNLRQNPTKCYKFFTVVYLKEC